MDDFDIEYFITTVEQYSAIWDKTSHDYKDRRKRKAAWENVFSNFVEDYENLSETNKYEKGKVLMQKWTNLRDAWMKNHKLIKSQKTGPGYKRRRKYVFYDQLCFLTKTLDDPETSLNPPEEEFEYEYCPDQVSSIASPLKKFSIGKCSSQKRKPDEMDEKPLPTVNRAESLDEHQSFFDSLLPTVRKFDDSQKIEFRLEVLQLIKKIQISSKTEGST